MVGDQSGFVECGVVHVDRTWTCRVFPFLCGIMSRRQQDVALSGRLSRAFVVLIGRSEVHSTSGDSR